MKNEGQSAVRFQDIDNHRAGITPEQVRRQITAAILLALILLGLPTLVLNILNDFKLSAPASLGASLGLIFKPGTVAYLVTIGMFVFRKKLSVGLIAATSIFLLMLVGFNSLVDLGFIGSGMLYFMIACALGALFFDGWRAFALAIVSIVAIAVGGWLWVSGIRTFYFDPAEYATSLNTYVVRMVTIFFFLAIIVGSIRRMNGFLTEALRSQARLNADLRESEEFRKRVFESSIMPIIVMDADSYEYLDCNQVAVDIYQFKSREETLGKTPLDVSAPVQYDGTPSEEKTRYYINEALEKGAVVFEWLHRRPDGGLWDAEVHLLSFSIEGRKMLQFSLVDITERKRVADLLRRQNKYLVALQETMLELVSQQDAETLLENIVKRAGDLLGTPSGFLDLVDPATGQLLPRFGMGALADLMQYPVQPGEGVAGIVWQTGKPFIVQDYDRWADRAVSYPLGKLRSVIGVPLLSGGKVMGALGLSYGPDTNKTFGDEDVGMLEQFARMAAIALVNVTLFTTAQQELSERRRTEDALIRQTAMFRNLFERSPDAITVVDRDDRILNVNRSFERLFGYLEAEAQGHYVNDLIVSKPYLDEAQDITRASLGGSGQIVEKETIRCTKDGRPVDVTLIGYPIVVEGCIIGGCGIYRDITSRKRAEEELKASEEKFRTMIEQASEGFALIDENGIIIEWNRAMERIWGCPREQALGKPFYEIQFSRVIPERRTPERYEQLKATLMDALRTGQSPVYGRAIESELYCPDGQHVFIQQSIFPIKTAHGYRIGSMSLDITERKQADQKMREAQLVLENSPVVLFRWKAAEGWPVELVSENITQFGYTPDEFLSGAVLYASIVHPDDLERVGREVREYSASGVGRFHQEYRIVTRDGRIRWTDDRTVVERDDQGRIMHYQGVVVDITERKQAEEELKRQTTLFRKLFESSPEAIALLNHEDRALEVNRSFEILFGYLEAEARGKTINELVAREPYLDDAQDVSRAVLGNGQVVEKESVRCTKDDRPVDVSIIGYPIVVEGHMIGAFAIYRDITERKRAEEAIQQAYKLLAAKNKELEQIVYVASHDLRSPLVNVDGFGRELEYDLNAISEALEGNAGSPAALEQTLRAELPDMKKSLERIRNSARQMDTLLKGLLKLSRSGRAALHIAPLDMNELMRQVCASFAFRIREVGAELTVEDLPACQGDAVQLTQVFANLLDNAIKYRDNQRQCQVRIRGQVEGNRAVYRVEDNGIGIAGNHQENIFGLFHRLNPADTEGEGLGLTIARQMLDRLDGEIKVESQPGVGSAFIVSLPRVPGRKDG